MRDGSLLLRIQALEKIHEEGDNIDFNMRMAESSTSGAVPLDRSRPPGRLQRDEASRADEGVRPTS